MKISISATNPCHLYPVALELAKRDALGCYYSGYPAWKLNAPPELSLRTHSLRTNIVYGLLKYVPERWRPSSKQLYRWQDGGFDRWTGAHLASCDFIHAMPGQALHTFRAAKRLGIREIILPRQNEKNVNEDLDDELRAGLTLHLVGSIDEVLLLALVPVRGAAPARRVTRRAQASMQ